MTKTLKLNKPTEQGILEFLKYILESGKVKGIFTLKRISNNEAIAYSLITDPDELRSAVPFYPLMPVNAGKLMSRFTLKEGTKKPVAAVLKPCELRGFVELIKREQGNLDNLFIISSTCGGVFPSKTEVDKTAEKKLPKYWVSVKKGEISPDLRSLCKACEELTPYSADITFDIVGNIGIDKQTNCFLNTKKGEDLAKDIKSDILEKEIDKKKLDSIGAIRQIEKKKLFNEIDKKMDGIDGLVDIFGKCINCHGCSKVCPICYCKLCEFESPDSEYSPSNFESEIKRRGGLKVPPGTLYYQIGRLSHIGISCVSCGACEDVCPVGIPVSIIFKRVGESIQKMFGYVPGKDVEEALPLVTFKQEEFSEIEE